MSENVETTWTLSLPITFEEALEVVEQLPDEAQQELIDVIKHRVSERRREEIQRHAEETLQALKEGRARYGTVVDLMREVDEDDEE